MENISNRISRSSGRPATRKIRRRIALLSVAAFSAIASPAQAAPNTWIAGSGNWNNPANWVFGVPNSSFNTQVIETDGVNRVITYDYPGNITLTSLTLDLTNFTGTNTTTLNMAGFSLTSGLTEDIGNSGGGTNGRATLNQSGGTNTMATLRLGFNPTDTGTYILSGGTVSAGNEYIGLGGSGIFTQTGGGNFINASGSLYVGYVAGTTGSYTMSNSTAGIAGGVYVGGFAAPGGVGTLSVGSGATMTIGGTLTAFNTAGSSVSLNGGTISLSSLVTNGSPSVFSWTTGNLNFTTSQLFDSGAANSTAPAAFGSSLALATGQNLSIAGDEVLGGTGVFALTLNSGSSHYVSGLLTVNPNGTLTQNAGSSFYAGSISQSGGAITGTLINQGAFTYHSGIFSGKLVNQGTVSFGPAFTAGGGILNSATMAVTTGQTLTAGAPGLDNQGMFTLSGGTIVGTVINNNNFTFAGGSISGPFTNGFAGNASGHFAVTGQFINNGIFTADGVLTLGAGSNSNVGFLRGSGDIIGSLTNSGIIQANGNSPLAFTSLQGNTATIQINPASILNVANAWGNGGVVQLLGAGALLGGNTITNTGTIQGAGQINSSIANSTGVIQAQGGQLTLAGASNTSGATSQIQISTGNTVFYTQGLTSNAGTIALTGGTFDNDNRAMTNTGYISGTGIFRSGGLTNNGFLYIGGNTQIFGPVTNGAAGAINATGTGLNAFYGPVTNTAGGSFGVQSGASVTFFNSYTGASPVPNNGTVTFAITGVSGPIIGNGQTILGNGSISAVQIIPGSAASSQSSIIINNGSSLDLANNILNINYAANPDPVSTLTNYLASGYNHGAWNGAGINTSMGDAHHGLGIVDDGLKVEIAWTLYGDTNLDGSVNFTDLVNLAQNYNRTNANWLAGDFTYDKTVNFADLVALAQNYNGVVVPGEDGISPAFVSDWNLARSEIAAVPEPASLAIFSAALLIRRRRRHRF